MITDIRAHYDDLLRRHGDSPEAVQYSSQESQERRFELLLQVGDLQDKSILDFGCGTAHLLDYMTRLGLKVNYYGVDIVEGFIDLCRKKHPQAHFGQLDNFSHLTFDYILVGGVFNNKMSDNEDFYRRTLVDLFKRCRRGLSFNMMSAYVDYQNPDLYYEYPEKVFGFLKREVTPYVTLRNDYEVKPGVIPFDFTVYAYRGGQ
jgi:SAM-dependent methyltransferase